MNTQKQILVIDDDPFILSIMQKALKMKGFCCDTSYSGTDALAKISDKAYDLIILDLELPDYHGIELFQMFKNVHPALPHRVMFSSGNLPDMETEKILVDYNIRYLVKPFALDELEQNIRWYFTAAQDHSVGFAGNA
jgi:DNA-binding NtrC family response regulator